MGLNGQLITKQKSCYAIDERIREFENNKNTMDNKMLLQQQQSKTNLLFDDKFWTLQMEYFN